MRYLIFICLIVVGFSCKNNTAKKETGVILETLILNQEKPWIVNNETHTGITKMDSLITKFTASKGQNYTLLGESLSKQTSYIIKNCSMKGTAHDQLHVVLVPMLDEISIMREVNNITVKKAALLKLQIYITKYFEHFTIE
ncbi:hypothetical protein Q4Q39_12675 [Flavivirga amylovorans]|uniref:Uncharacterized protein n=1 Tax=Flavivirga amylovorans TaxID=870486 RepID=A0ABT8X2S7_9FLAO|nr:hypothetical protein [Flavivirga amylovorans]MDO5988262.1 hypothetical protein [Flavivirga amylovorans]